MQKSLEKHGYGRHGTLKMQGMTLVCGLFSHLLFLCYLCLNISARFARAEQHETLCKIRAAMLHHASACFKLQFWKSLCKPESNESNESNESKALRATKLQSPRFPKHHRMKNSQGQSLNVPDMLRPYPGHVPEMNVFGYP